MSAPLTDKLRTIPAPAVFSPKNFAQRFTAKRSEAMLLHSTGFFILSLSFPCNIRPAQYQGLFDSIRQAYRHYINGIDLKGVLRSGDSAWHDQRACLGVN